MLLTLLFGFRHFFLAGRESDNTPIPGPIRALVVVHGAALMAWTLGFLVQSWLIASRRSSLHFALGWMFATAALVVLVTGPMVAIAAPRLRPNEVIYGLKYTQFILPMLTEITAFVCFVALGLSFRNKRVIHRPMMLLATLSVFSGATSRTGFCDQIFGDVGWQGLFGPVFAFGAFLLLLRLALTGSFDRWFAAGLAGMSAVYIASCYLANTAPWTHFSMQIASR
jgi:hypothetical protein